MNKKFYKTIDLISGLTYFVDKPPKTPPKPTQNTKIDKKMLLLHYPNLFD
jgi:hypothetical protein